MSSPLAYLVALQAGLLRLFARRRPPKSRSPDRTRILCLTAGGVSEMIDTLPLLYALHRHYPRSLIGVACEEAALPIAMACPAIKVVTLYQRGILPGLGAIQNALRLQGFEWALVATPSCHGRLARLSRLCNAKVRIGFSRHPKRPAPYLTESVALPDKSENEHRIETLLRLLSPFGLVRTTNWALELGLRLPASAVAFAAETLENRPFILAERFVLINFSAIRHGLREEDIIVLLRRLLTTTPLAVGLLAEMDDQQTSREIAMVLASDRVATVDPMTPIETAALISKADALLTGGDIPAHLASAVDTPAVILWTRGDFDRTHSRSARHVFLRAAPKQTVFELEQVWQALQPMLTLRKSDVEDQWEGLLHQPRDSDDPSP